MKILQGVVAFLLAAATMWTLTAILWLLAWPLVIVVAVAALLRKRHPWAQAVFIYIRNAWVAIDQCANALGGGHPDETISSRAGRSIVRAQIARREPHWLTWFVAKWTNLFDPGHVEKSIEESARVRAEREAP